MPLASYSARTGWRGRFRISPAAPDALDLTYDEAAALRKTYAFFLHPGFRKTAAQDVPGFLSTDLGDGIRFGIDEDLFQKLEGGAGGVEQGADIEPILATLADRRALPAAPHGGYLGRQRRDPPARSGQPAPTS